MRLTRTCRSCTPAQSGPGNSRGIASSTAARSTKHERRARRHHKSEVRRRLNQLLPPRRVGDVEREGPAPPQPQRCAALRPDVLAIWSRGSAPSFLMRLCHPSSCRHLGPSSCPTDCQSSMPDRWQWHPGSHCLGCCLRPGRSRWPDRCRRRRHHRRRRSAQRLRRTDPRYR